MTRYNQDDTRISAHCSTRITQRIESCNYLSRTGVEVYRRTIWLQNRNRNDIWRARTAHEHWKEQWQLQRQKAKVLQLQQIWAYGQRMLEEEREENLEMFQIQQRRVHSQELQRKEIDEETKELGKIRGWRQWREGQEIGFWRRSWVGTVWEISPVNSKNKYVIPN